MNNFKYNKLDLITYYKNLKEILKNEDLKKLNITYSSLGKTYYDYDIDCITLGFGDKELFLVGGTHGSEIITTDFILNFINQLKNTDIDWNKIKLIILPLQNPEGFDITTNTIREINNADFSTISYEYYLKYKIDNLITNILKNLASLNLDREINPFKTFKDFINTNNSWNSLKNIIPNINFFNISVNSINSLNNYNDFLVNILSICDKLLITNPLDETLSYFVSELKNFFITPQKNSYINVNWKLHQKMFQNTSYNNLKSSKLTVDTEKIYKNFNHPKGSQITHDSTGLSINLNANTKLNPGIEHIKNNITIYGPNAKSNIKNYTKGPLGIPTLDPYNFKLAKENEILENLIKNSIAKGNYLATFLYHATGGLIYYKPYEKLMTKENYSSFISFNEWIANIYAEYTNYKMLDESNYTGYGDYLRRTYPGVILIELSKMGGNPIAPYGDKENIYNVFNDNTKALTKVIANLTKGK